MDEGASNSDSSKCIIQVKEEYLKVKPEKKKRILKYGFVSP